MKKTIHRDLIFTTAEVKTAIVEMLRKLDHPYPQIGAINEVFSLGENGASLIWTEVVDEGH